MTVPRGLVVVCALAVVAGIGACSDDPEEPSPSPMPPTLSPETTPTSAPPTDPAPPTDSPAPSPDNLPVLDVAITQGFTIPAELVSQFEADHRVKVNFLPPPETDAQLLTIAEANSADVLLGLDTPHGARAMAQGLVEPYESAALANNEFPSPGLTPYAISNVCVNADTQWFAEANVVVPSTMDDLRKPEYAKLLAGIDPSASNSGMAFLMGTIEAYPQDWPAIWRDLKSGGAEITESWAAAYLSRFTAMGGNRPLVVAYSSSPVLTIPEGEQSPTTAVLENTCVQQPHYAAVAARTDTLTQAQAFVDFMVSYDTQRALVDTMLVYPASSYVSLPAAMRDQPSPTPNPSNSTQQVAGEKLDEWLATWSETQQ